MILLPLEDQDARDLTILLEQTAVPGSLQTRLINCIDALLDEHKRDRYAGSRRHSNARRTRPHETRYCDEATDSGHSSANGLN